MHNSITFSCLVPNKMAPNNRKVLSAILLFEFKITDTLDFYDLKTRMCTNGSKMVKEQDYEISDAPAADEKSLRFITSNASE